MATRNGDKPQAFTLIELSKTVRKGFTLIELLVVIAVMIILFTVAVPAVSKLMNAGRQDSALGSLGAAIAATRSLAGRNPVMPQGVTYQGTALIVTPSNEMRVVEHFRDVAGVNRFTGASMPYACYRDVPGEGYISIPKGVGLVGIGRRTAGAPFLMAPPFALRFDRYGHLIVRQRETGAVVYNGDYSDLPSPPAPANNNNDYEVPQTKAPTPVPPTTWRANNYDPEDWDPEISGKVIAMLPDDHNFDKIEQKYKMKFETLETVIGVIAFDKQALRSRFPTNPLAAQPMTGDAYGGDVGNLHKDVGPWLLENGTVMFFNRYSGAVIKP